MKRILLVILFVLAFAFAPILLMAVVQNWSATNLQAVSSFYVGSKNVFSFLDGLVDNQTVTNSIGDSTITQPKLSQALVDFIGSGGSVINNPDDQTLETTGGSTIALKENYAVAENIADLESWAKHDLEIGDVVYLREVATGGYGGGEMVYSDSTDLKARLGSAVADSVVIFHAPTTDRVWYRKAFDNDRRFNVLWAGARPTGLDADSATNNTALTKIWTRAIATGARQVYFPGNGKSYIWTKPLRSARAAAVGFVIDGDGIYNTYLIFKGTGAAFEDDNGATYQSGFIARNFTLLGNSSSVVSGSKGFNFTNTNLPRIQNVNIEYFAWGIDMTGQPNNFLLDHIGVAQCSIAVDISGNANGGSIRNPEITNNDTLGIRISNGGSGITIEGGESGSQPVSLAIADAGLVTVLGHSFESNNGNDNSADVVLGANASVNFIGTRWLKGTPNHYGVYATTAAAKFIGCNFSGYTKTKQVFASNNFCNFTGIPNKNSELLVNDQGTNFYTVGPFITYNDGNFGPATDSTRRGQIYRVVRRHGIDVSDNLFFYQETKNGKVWAQPLNSFNDVRFATSGADSAGYVRIDRARMIVFRKDLTSAATFFTKDTIQVDKYSQYYLADVQAQWDSDSLLSAHPRTWSNTNGQVIATVNHPTVTAGGATIRLYYTFIYQARSNDY